jgi:hypothetical protein
MWWPDVGKVAKRVPLPSKKQSTLYHYTFSEGVVAPLPSPQNSEKEAAAALVFFLYCTKPV